MRFIESASDFFRGVKVRSIADDFRRLMVVREVVDWDSDTFEVSLDYALGLSGSERRPRVPSGRTRVGRRSYGPEDLLVVTILSRPDEGEVHPEEDTVTYLMGVNGQVFILTPDSEESSTPPDEGAAERAILLNESVAPAFPVSGSEADWVVSLAAEAVAVAKGQRR